MCSYKKKYVYRKNPFSLYKVIFKTNDTINVVEFDTLALIAVVGDYFPTFNLILKFKR